MNAHSIFIVVSVIGFILLAVLLAVNIYYFNLSRENKSIPNAAAVTMLSLNSIFLAIVVILLVWGIVAAVWGGMKRFGNPLMEESNFIENWIGRRGEM